MMTASFDRWLLLAVLLLGIVPIARADEPAPAASVQAASPAAAVAKDSAIPDPGAFGTVAEQVQQHLQKARACFTSGQYDAAIRELHAAYQLKPNPNYLFSIAQSHRRAGRNREALATYQRFLRESPQTPLKAETISYMTELTLLLQQQDTIDREKRRPVWKKGWFWGVLSSSVVAVGVALGAGLAVGLADKAETLSFSFGPDATQSALRRASAAR